jgi:hypothetical protein
MINLDQLLPKDILDKVNSKTLELSLSLVGQDCCGSWPKCKILINNLEIFDGTVIDKQIVKYSKIFNNNDHSVTIKIIRYGKTNIDTRTTSDGKITDNQILSINELMLNGINTIENNLIYKGIFNMDLSSDKREYFHKNNINTQTNDYHFYENGTWELYLELPILTYIINTRKKLETYETIGYQKIMLDIINKIGIQL